jgi:hypothetical protein
MDQLWSELGLPVPNLPASEWKPVHWTAIKSWNQKHEALLRSWAGDLNLHYDWVLSEASAQLTTWRSIPEIKRAFAGILGYDAPRFYIESWHVDHEREIPYRKRMKAKFEAALEAHIGEVKRLRSYLLPDRGSRATHYHWAAERVCLGRKGKDIANHNPVHISWQAVRNGVQPILTKIGILPTQPKRRKKTASKVVENRSNFGYNCCRTIWICDNIGRHWDFHRANWHASLASAGLRFARSNSAAVH